MSHTLNTALISLCPVCVCLCVQLDGTVDLDERRLIRSAIRELRRREIEDMEAALASKRFRPTRLKQQEDKENQHRWCHRQTRTHTAVLKTKCTRPGQLEKDSKIQWEKSGKVKLGTHRGQKTSATVNFPFSLFPSCTFHTKCFLLKNQMYVYKFVSNATTLDKPFQNCI